MPALEGSETSLQSAAEHLRCTAMNPSRACWRSPRASHAGTPPPNTSCKTSKAPTPFRTRSCQQPPRSISIAALSALQQRESQMAKPLHRLYPSKMHCCCLKMALLPVPTRTRCAAQGVLWGTCWMSSTQRCQLTTAAHWGLLQRSLRKCALLLNLHSSAMQRHQAESRKGRSQTPRL